MCRAPWSFVRSEVESYKSRRYWLCPCYIWQLLLISSIFFFSALTTPPFGRLLVSFASLRAILRRRVMIPVYPSPRIVQQTLPWPLPAACAASLTSSSLSSKQSVKETVYIEGRRGSHQKERRKRVSIRLSGVSFLQQQRGDFIERLLQSIDRPSGMDTVKPRMKSERARERWRDSRSERNTEAE